MEKPILAAMLSIDGTKLSDEEIELFKKFNPLGVTLFSKNIQNNKQLKSLTDEIRNILNRDDVLIAVDHEGGRVQRLHEPEFRSYAAQIELGRLEEKFDFATVLQTAQNQALLIAQELLNCGINWNYAPCLDIYYPQTADVLKSRCFSSDEKKVALLGKKMIEAYTISGICPCIKHLPGHGRATVDPHLRLPVINTPLSELKKDFYPFSYNQQAPAGMTAHIIIKDIDDTLPVSQSKTAIDNLIRKEIGFEGFLISDSINMNALKGNIVERALACLDAGCDAVCYCHGNIKEMFDLCKNCPALTDNSMIRLAKIKNIFQNKSALLDYNQIEKNYIQICQNIVKYTDNYDATEVLRQMNN